MVVRMPRKTRDIRPGFQHVWVGATGDAAYFRDEVDRITWVRELRGTLATMGWACVGFCQMTTHVHLLAHVLDDSLPVGMRDLNRE